MEAVSRASLREALHPHAVHDRFAIRRSDSFYVLIFWQRHVVFSRSARIGGTRDGVTARPLALLGGRSFVGHYWTGVRIASCREDATSSSKPPYLPEVRRLRGGCSNSRRFRGGGFEQAVSRWICSSRRFRGGGFEQAVSRSVRVGGFEVDLLSPKITELP